MRHLNDLFHSGLNDVGEVLDRYFLGSPVADTWNGNYFIGTGFFRNGFSKTSLELLGLFGHHHQSMLNVGGEDVAAKRDDGGMTNNVVIKDRDVSGPSTN